MGRFRSSSPFPSSTATLPEVRALIADAIRPANFFVDKALPLAWEHHDCVEVFWELFRGWSLDQTRTRRKQSFESWDIVDRSRPDSTSEPLISVKLDETARQIHVTRSILCRAWEGYADGEIIHSRESVRAIRELVGSIDLIRLSSAADIHDELIAQLFLAITGTSRLPLTSLEAPLPDFTLGQLAYCYRHPSGSERIGDIDIWLESAAGEHFASREWSRLLETVIRASPADQIGRAAETWAKRCQAFELMGLLRDMFNDVALSPYTEFVSNTLSLVNHLVWLGALSRADEADFLTQLLRQLCRHLTAFDLVQFHHRGANYPDALLLDEAVNRLGRLIEASPEFFVVDNADTVDDARRKRLRRRALRQAWLIRQQYRGHAVPDAPTSPGENARVLPAPYPHVPEVQITSVGARTRRLFENPSTIDQDSGILHDVLVQSIHDLAAPAELRELGAALFLDRPFGFAKAPGEPDATLMLSHEAFSRQVAASRLELLCAISPGLKVPDFEALPHGVDWRYNSSHRPGVVSILDARLAARDFVMIRTTQRSVRELFEQYDFDQLGEQSSLEWIRPQPCLILPGPDSPDELTILDAVGRPRLQLHMDATNGYISRAGNEYLAAGMRLEGAWDDGSRLLPLGECRQILPRVE